MVRRLLFPVMVVETLIFIVDFGNGRVSLSEWLSRMRDSRPERLPLGEESGIRELCGVMVVLEW